MSDVDDGQEDESQVIRELRAQVKTLKGADTEASTLRQENALLKAGLDLTPIQAKALLATHDGEMDPEALKATATELGFAKPPEAAQPIQRDAEQAAVATGLDAIEEAGGTPQQTSGSPSFEEELAAVENDYDKTMEVLERHGRLTEEAT